MSDFISQIKKERQEMIPFIEQFFQTELEHYRQFSFGEDLLNKLLDFVSAGKMSRSALFLLAYQNSQETDSDFKKQILLPIALSLELIHSALLIHDDIIDRDQTRRGQDSIWKQYQLSANDRHYGESQAICVADFAFFSAQTLISQAMANLVHFPGMHSKNALTISQLINREINQVILAEMLDSKLAIQKNETSKNEILEMYRYKTARYTFSLPLILAAKLANIDNQSNKKIAQVGEKIGLIFQIRDDYLGIFGDPKITGKPIAGDIKEGKRTIFYHYLLENSAFKENDKARFLKNFGQAQIEKTELSWLQSIIKKYALAAVEKLITQLETEALELNSSIKSEAMQSLLQGALDFASERQK